MSFVAGVRRSWRPSVFIQFTLDSFYADCPHKRIIIFIIMKVYMERKNMQLELIKFS